MAIEFFPCGGCGYAICDAESYTHCKACGRSFHDGCRPQGDACPVCSQPPFEAPYTNWRGETRRRMLIPLRVWFGSTGWHPTPQWLLQALDVEDGKRKDFALSGFVSSPGNNQGV